MSRQRVIHPEMWIDPGFMSLSPLGRLLWIGLINHADDEGRGSADPKSLKAGIFPGDAIDDGTVEKLKMELLKYVRVVFYFTNEREYYQLIKWLDYQKISHPSPSKIPPIPRDLTKHSGNIHGTLTESSAQLINQSINQSINGDSSKPPGPSFMRPGASRSLPEPVGKNVAKWFAGVTVQEE